MRVVHYTASIWPWFATYKMCYKKLISLDECHFDNRLLILQLTFYFFDVMYLCICHKLFSEMLFHDSSHSSECLLLYVLGELLMSSMHGLISLLPKWHKLVSFISFFVLLHALLMIQLVPYLDQVLYSS
jgi:hypothetical protein